MGLGSKGGSWGEKHAMCHSCTCTSKGSMGTGRILICVLSNNTTNPSENPKSQASRFGIKFAARGKRTEAQKVGRRTACQLSMKYCRGIVRRRQKSNKQERKHRRKSSSVIGRQHFGGTKALLDRNVVGGRSDLKTGGFMMASILRQNTSMIATPAHGPTLHEQDSLLHLDANFLPLLSFAADPFLYSHHDG